MNMYAKALPTYPVKLSKFKYLPRWPGFSIVFLIVIAALFSPAILTAMNGYLLVIAFAAWIGSGKPFDRNLLKIAGPFILIVAIGLIIGRESERYLYLKDIWYVSNPMITICVGYVFFRCMPDVSRGLRAFVIGGTLLAMLHLAKFALNPQLFSMTAVELRAETGTGYYAPVLALMILFAFRNKWSEQLAIPRSLGWYCTLICATAVLASFSRTMFIVVAIGFLASWGAFARREWLRIGVVLTVAFVMIAALRLTVDVESNDASKSFIGKLARSTDELSIQEYTDFRSINLNWRGYETARAFNSYAAGTPSELLFGKGLGATLDLGFYMRLGSGIDGERTAVRYIPVLHNGYGFLLLKGGAVAMVLFLYSLISLYRIGRRFATGNQDQASTRSARLLQGIVIALLFTTWVITGVFNKLDMFPFLLVGGFLLAPLTLNEK